MVRRTLAAIRTFLPVLHCQRSDTDWLVHAIDGFLPGVVSPSDIPVTKLKPRRGMITEYPVFSALAAQPVEPNNRLTVRRLQALYLLAIGALESDLSDPSYRSSIASAGRACRVLARGSLIDGRLLQIAQTAVSPESLCDSLERLADAAEEWASDDSRKAVEALRPLMRYVRDDLTPRRVSRRTGGRRNKSAPVQSELISDENTGRQEWYKLTHDTLPVGQRAERQANGLPSIPETTRSTLFHATPSSRNDKFPAHTQTDYQANQRLILRARAFKTGVQLIPNRTDTLHDAALVPLVSPSGDWSKGLNSPQLTEAMLGTMLLLGCEVDALEKLRVWSSREDVPDPPLVGGVVLRTQEFVLPIHRLPESWQPAPESRAEHRSTHTSLYLPTPTILPVAQRLFAHAAQRCGQTLFEKRDFAAAIDAAVSAINAIHQTQITATRLARHLWRATYELDSDSAEALLLSYSHRESNDPRLYYYAPARSHLARQYFRVWRGLAARIGLRAGGQSQPSADQDGHVGSAAVPRLDAIQATIRQLVADVRSLVATKGRRSVAQWVAIHNAMTVYVIRQIQWLTGIRAVLDPVELDLYDPASGYLGVIDKDSDDRYGARAVWLIEPIRHQVEIYKEKVQSATGAIFQQSDLSAAFRLIDPETHQIQEVDREALLAVTPDYPFAPNAHRHYMRTRLRELGVNAGFVDAWLGHGGVGREPYARHSALSPDDVRRAVAPALLTIWEELGWAILPNR